MNKSVWFLLAAGLELSLCAHATKVVPASHRVEPGTVDWQCAQNTLQFIAVDLQDAHLANQNKIDYRRSEIHLLMKKAFGHGGYEYVYYIVVHPDHGHGKPISLITVTTTDGEECPSDNIKTYLVSRQFGKLPALQ